MKSNISWIYFIARRYLKKNKATRGISHISFGFAIAGITGGVLALIIIIAVMNGFQLGFIESILEISSYHIRAETKNQTELYDLIPQIKNENGVLSVTPFAELEALSRKTDADRGSGIVLAIRALDMEYAKLDTRMMERLAFMEGGFNLDDEGAVLIGVEAARKLGVHLNDTINVLCISGNNPLLSSAEENNLTITGIFQSDYYEYDTTLAFINLKFANILDETSTVSLGIKIKDRFQDSIIIGKIQRLVTNNNITLKSWRSYNRAFYGALRTEKLFMFILVGLIFIVVGLNIYQSQKRLVLERTEEIALLRTIGASPINVRLIFTVDGCIIGGTGATLGTLSGVLISLNIDGFFTALEAIVNTFIGIVNSGGDFAIFSPTIFYLKEIPARLIPQEVIIIFLFGFLSSAVSSFFASKRASRISPQEVLRSE
jgi:lipoprotein-releasing system permease protein